MRKLVYLLCYTHGLVPQKLGEKTTGPIVAAITFCPPYLVQLLAIPSRLFVAGMLCHMGAVLLINLAYTESRALSQRLQMCLLFAMPAIIACSGLYLPALANILFLLYQFTIATICIGASVTSILPKINRIGRLFLLMEGVIALLAICACPYFLIALNKALIARIIIYNHITVICFFLVSRVLYQTNDNILETQVA